MFKDSEFWSKKGNKNFKKKKKKGKRKRGGGGGRDTLILHPHTFFASRLFLQTPSKALRNGPARGIKDERSYFAAHRPSRDSNRELVLGVVLFGCVPFRLERFLNFWFLVLQSAVRRGMGGEFVTVCRASLTR